MKRHILFLAVLLSAIFYSVGKAEDKVEQPVVKVAVVAGFSGADPNTAKELYRGVEVFLKENGEAKSSLQIEKYDNKGSVLETARLMNELAAKGIKLVVGIARSDEALAAAKIAQDKGMVFVTPFATNPKVGETGNLVFQTCFSDRFQGKVLGKMAKDEFKVRRLMVLVNSESLYSIGLSESFLKEFNSRNDAKAAQILEVRYTEKEIDFDGIGTKARNFKPDLVFVPDHITRAGLIAKSISRSVSRVRFLGGDGFGGKKILTGIFGDTPSIELYYTTHWHKDISTAANKRFVGGYLDLYSGDEPTSGAAMMFDSMSMVFRAVQESRNRADAVEIGKYLRRQTYSTTTGILKFPAQIGDDVKKQAVVLRLKDNQYGLYKTFR